ncbi:MAG: SMI1/KNR4 family protein [Anaerolineales bacterium]
MNRLFHLIAPPAKPVETGTLKSWNETEALLGVPLPADYKDLIDHYGTGSFGDLIMVYSPFTQIEVLNLFYALDTLQQADRQTQKLGDPSWTAVQPFAYYPALKGLLPWGCTRNLSQVFFWQVKGTPATWETVFYNLRSGEYEVWKYPMSAFLYRLFTHQIESVLLPEDFPGTEEPIRFITISG